MLARGADSPTRFSPERHHVSLGEQGMKIPRGKAPVTNNLTFPLLN